MTTRTYAAWVEPIAVRLREDSAQVVAFARAQPLEAWERPSPLEGWTCKDLLAHIGLGNDQIFQQVLRMAIAGAPIDTAVFAVNTDEANAREVASRRGLSVHDVIVEVEESGNEIQELLAQLTDEHEHLRQDRPPFILKTFLGFALKEGHDLEHLAQLRVAMEAPR